MGLGSEVVIPDGMNGAVLNSVDVPAATLANNGLRAVVANHSVAQDLYYY